MIALTLGSQFDGIGGFPYSASRHGINPVWASEIRPSGISITKRHFPQMRHLGDITQINGADIEPVDIITFGSPCQDLSVAGKRAGMQHEKLGDEETTRSGLFHEAMRIINEMREATNGAYPTWIIWENVPGALSSNNGLDFRAVLQSVSGAEIPMPGSGRWASAGMVRGGRCDISWRILDAQFWGVPQRRRRIFLVADFGGRSTAEVSFKPEGLRGYFAPGRKAGQEAAGNTGISIAAADDNGVVAAFGETGQGYWQNGIQTLRAEGENRPSRPSNVLVYPDVARTLKAKANLDHREDGDTLILCAATGQAGAEICENIVPTLNCNHEQPYVAGFNGWRSTTGTIEYEEGRAPCMQANMPPDVVVAGFMAGQGAKAGSIGYQEEVAPTLKSANSGLNMAPSVVAVRTAQTGSNGWGVSEDAAYTLDGASGQAVAVALDCRNHIANDNISGTLQAKSQGGHSLNYINPVLYEMIVRRLMPVECERSQGFPDGWTELGVFDLPILPKKLARDLAKGILRTGRTAEELLTTISDSARYADIGNSVAIPCVDYFIGGIAEIERARKNHPLRVAQRRVDYDSYSKNHHVGNTK